MLSINDDDIKISLLDIYNKKREIEGRHPQPKTIQSIDG